MRLLLLLLLGLPAFAHAGANYDAAVLADSPVVWWKQAEPSGATMTDSSGNGRNGTYFGAILGQPGIFGPGCSDTAALYDGLGGHYADGGNDAAFQVATTGSLTVEIWAKFVSLGVANHYAFISKGDRVFFPPDAFEWVIEPDGGVFLWDILQGAGADHSFVLSTTSVGTTDFQHIVGTTTDGVNTKIYVNGVLESTTTTFTGAAGNGIDAVWLAKITDCSVIPCVYNYLNTYLAEVAIYGTALSSTRILAHYNARQNDVNVCAAQHLRRRVYEMQ